MSIYFHQQKKDFLIITVDNFSAARLRILYGSFLTSRCAKGNSDKSQKNYRAFVGYFVMWVEEQRPALFADLIEAYSASLYRSERSRATSDSYINYVLVFANWLTEKHRLIKLPGLRPKHHAGNPKAMTREQLIAAFAAMNPDTKFMTRFLLDTALRLNEALAITKADVNIYTMTFVVRGKGGKLRQVAMGDGVADQCRARICAIADGDRLFPLKDSSYQTRYQRLSEKLGFRVNQKRLRHSFARFFMTRGGDVGTLQKILGHSTPAMSLHYARVFGTDATAKQREMSPVDWIDRSQSLGPLFDGVEN